MMPTTVKAPATPLKPDHGFYGDEDGTMSTIPDPRSRIVSPESENFFPTSPHHPDLNEEVATLSTKLVNAINYQTNLDDTLSATRHELESMQKLMRQLEEENREHTDLVARGVLIRKSVADVAQAKLMDSLVEERRLRSEIEAEKNNMERELESLTTALFEEANRMVITAREESQKEHDIVQRRNEQLKAQLADTESLLRSHQEQLAELKLVMEQMAEERDDLTSQTAPSTPGMSKVDIKDLPGHDLEIVHVSSLPDPVTPTYPTSFTHLLQTVLRTDLTSYDEFTSLIRTSKNVHTGSRASSGSYGSIGLGLGGHSALMPPPSNGSTSSLSTAATAGSLPVTPTTPASTVSSNSTNGPNHSTPLKDTKFYKRVLVEDVEPTLRLDSAPGLSWLARRTVLNAVSEGTLIVEPMPLSNKNLVLTCALCGESRKDPEHKRGHRFRSSESQNAQRYPLCRYCLGRVRSTCDFLGFLRILKEGHWRCDDEESERAAWDESVRLREQMFWCRMGGGVVPVMPVPEFSKSPRIVEEEKKKEERRLSQENQDSRETDSRDITPARGALTLEEIEKVPKSHDQEVGSELAKPAERTTSDDGAEKQDTKTNLAPATSLQVTFSEVEGKEGAKKLLIQIPGAFV